MVARSHSSAVNTVAVFSGGNAPVSTPGFGGVMSFFMSVCTFSQPSRLLYQELMGKGSQCCHFTWLH